MTRGGAVTPRHRAPGGRSPGRASSVRLAGCCSLVTALLLASGPVRAVDVKLWPLIDYHSDTAGHRRLHLLGPLFAYEDGPEQHELTLRPVFSLIRGRRTAQGQLTFLYPLFASRWDPRQAEHRLFGLITYGQDRVEQTDTWEHHFTAFPFVFYRDSPTAGPSLSILPFYANFSHFFGYEHVQLVFPLYLHLKKQLTERTWAPFPFISWSGGPLGRGYAIWPFYGWGQEGETERFMYVMWPFYVVRERHFARRERERRLTLFPVYACIDSEAKWSRTYGFVTHTIDRRRGKETWGFPWPLWLRQRDLTTGERTVLRLAPFYGDTRVGDLRSRFLLWPLYRSSAQEVDAYRYRRTDVLLLLYQDVEQVQLENHSREHRRALFPLFRTGAGNGHSEASTLALLDALFPHNPSIEHLYAPLWQLYTQQRRGTQQRWSLLWDLISSDGTQRRYPVSLDLSE